MPDTAGNGVMSRPRDTRIGRVSEDAKIQRQPTKADSKSIIVYPVLLLSGYTRGSLYWYARTPRSRVLRGILISLTAMLAEKSSKC